MTLRIARPFMTHSDRCERCRGVALTEFALVIPVVFVLFIGILDFGRVFYAAMAVSNAALRTTASPGISPACGRRPRMPRAM